jgi:hypothetical protein
MRSPKATLAGAHALFSMLHDDETILNIQSHDVMNGVECEDLAHDFQERTHLSL